VHKAQLLVHLNLHIVLLHCSCYCLQPVACVLTPRGRTADCRKTHGRLN